MATTLFVAFTSAANPTFVFVPPYKNYCVVQTAVAGQTDNFRVTITNMDNVLVADVYATIMWDQS